MCIQIKYSDLAQNCLYYYYFYMSMQRVAIKSLDDELFSILEAKQVDSDRSQTIMFCK